MDTEKYPELAAELDQPSRTRYNDILQELVDSDAEYNALRRARAEASRALREVTGDKDALEAYTDAVLAQECHELEAVYRRGFTDALEFINKLGFK